MLTNDDGELILFLAGAPTCSLDSSPKTNWVENSGGLPNYICRIARAVMRSGKSKSSAIAIAVSRVKKWAAGAPGVDAKTRGKAAAAVAEWEALKAKNKAKKIVKATRDDGSEYLLLSESYNTDMVRRSWDAQERARREEYQQANPGSNNINAPASAMYPYRWIREVWSDYIIVESDEGDGDCDYLKIPYTYEDGEIKFGTPVEVEQIWQEVPNDDLGDDDLNEIEKYLMNDALQLTDSNVSYLGVIQGIVANKK